MPNAGAAGGSITRTRRLLTQAEQAFVAVADSDSEHRSRFGTELGALGSIREVVEFRVDIFATEKPPEIAELSPDKQLYVLKVEEGVIFGFELCFLQYAYVDGQFPRKTVAVAFGILDSIAAGSTPKVLEAWPISYCWSGEPTAVLNIELCERPPFDEILPIYRFWAFEEAVQRLAGP